MPKQIFAKEYEEYLISGKEEVLNSLPSGSIEKEYFILIRKLLKEELTSELQKEIDEFLRRIPKSQSYRLKALNIFKKLKTNPKNKSDIIQDIKRLFNLGEAKSYSKPVKYSKVSNEKKDEIDSEKLPNSLNINEYIKTNKFIEDIYNGSIIPNDDEYKKVLGHNFANFNLDFNKIPENTLVKIFSNTKDFRLIFNSVSRAIIYAKFDYFKKVFTLIIQECVKKDEKKKEFRNYICNNVHLLLNEQINFLLEYKKDFNFDKLISELINRKFSGITEDKLERVKTLKEIKQLLNEYQYKDDKMTRNVLFSILDLNSKMNNFELDTFIEYIQVPLYENPSIYNIDQKLKDKIMSNQNQTDCFLSQIIEPSFDNEKKLIENYLKHFYLKNKLEFKQLNKYFNENYFKRFYAKMQFYLGSEQPTKDNILSSYEINDLMKETILTICDFNKEEFNINDDVVLFLEIKNIQTLYVNIYQINTENYYYSNKKKFEDNISLDGIVPTYEDII
jgi:hypothetical protein